MALKPLHLNEVETFKQAVKLSSKEVNFETFCTRIGYSADAENEHLQKKYLAFIRLSEAFLVLHTEDLYNLLFPCPKPDSSTYLNYATGDKVVMNVRDVHCRVWEVVQFFAPAMKQDGGGYLIVKNEDAEGTSNYRADMFRLATEDELSHYAFQRSPEHKSK